MVELHARHLAFAIVTVRGAVASAYGREDLIATIWYCLANALQVGRVAHVGLRDVAELPLGTSNTSETAALDRFRRCALALVHERHAGPLAFAIVAVRLAVASAHGLVNLCASFWCCFANALLICGAAHVGRGNFAELPLGTSNSSQTAAGLCLDPKSGTIFPFPSSACATKGTKHQRSKQELEAMHDQDLFHKNHGSLSP
jgi:hypothetical protein